MLELPLRDNTTNMPRIDTVFEQDIPQSIWRRLFRRPVRTKTAVVAGTARPSANVKNRKGAPQTPPGWTRLHDVEVPPRSRGLSISLDIGER